MVLSQFDATLYGISLGTASTPSNYNVSKIGTKIKDYRIDIRDLKKLRKKINSINPDIIFNLAAQSLVRGHLKIPLILGQPIY